MTTLPNIGAALKAAIEQLRTELGDATASIVVLARSNVNGLFARRELAFATPYVRVDFITPEKLHTQLARPILRAKGLVPEPPGWLRSTLAELLKADDLGRYGETMRAPGWLPALTKSIATLEEAGLSGADLELSSNDVSERASVLGKLLERVAEKRRHEKLQSPRLIAAAALHAIETNASIPANEYAGAILLGDGRMGVTTFSTMQAYLKPRPVVRLDSPPMSDLAPAPGGLTRAAPHAKPIGLAAPAPEVAMVRAPDPVREVPEAVREVQDAILAGTPLDRIALVLPDVSEAVALREALERAGIPATWQTGPALADTPAARFLLHALNIASGDDSAASWYELLRAPGLGLQRNLGADATKGRGRWRRLLAKCGAYRGTARILSALDAYEAELAEKTEDEEQRQADAEAFASLRMSMKALQEALTFGIDAPIGGWARRFRQLLIDWTPAFPDQRKVVQLLDSWGRSLAGPKMSLAEAIETTTDGLKSTEYLRGSIKDASIRVLSPMQLLGGHFDLVCVLGMTQGRFPADPSPDPILSDPLIDALNASANAGLFSSSERIAIERRRFAAVRASTRGRLWLSSPRVNLDGGRPQLPGALLSDLASERAGKRLTYRDLEATMTAQGRRSRPFTTEPSRALGSTEHLLSRLAIEDAAALSSLADHPWARRLLGLHRALDRIRAGERSAGLRPYAGFVDATRLPCLGLDGEAISAEMLATLATSPAEFLYRFVLRAWPPVKLREHWDPMDRFYVHDTFLQGAQRELENPIDLESRLIAAFDEATTSDLERAGLTHDEVQQRLHAMGQSLGIAVANAGPATGLRFAFEGAPVSALPWRIEGEGPRIVGSGAEWLLRVMKSKYGKRQKLVTALEAAALQAAGHSVDAMRWLYTDGSDATPKSVDDEISKALEQLDQSSRFVQAGFYSGEPPSRFQFEQEKKVSHHLDEWEAP